MNILSLETTTDNASIAWIEDGMLLREYTWKSGDIAAGFMENFDRALSGCGDAASADKIVVSLGPGSWTGIRLGIALAKGLAAGDRKKLYALHTPDGFRYLLGGVRKPTVCIVNAHRGNFYYSVLSESRRIRRDGAVSISTGTLPEILAGLRRKTFFVGPAVPLASGEGLAKHRYAECAPAPLWYPRAGVNALAAYEQISRGIPSPPIEPFYGK